VLINRTYNKSAVPSSYNRLYEEISNFNQGLGIGLG
jgi:hypothetical protein